MTWLTTFDRAELRRALLFTRKSLKQQIKFQLITVICLESMAESEGSDGLTRSGAFNQIFDPDSSYATLEESKHDHNDELMDIEFQKTGNGKK